MPRKKEIERILWEADPMNLRPCGIPPNEYSPEAKGIHLGLLFREKLTDELELSDVLDVIYAVFVKMFGHTITGQREEYQEIAELIYTSIV